ncbi:hypothetical protein [Streptomyces goshikiensis]|uniref:hypothetical protein n=1 Tax=Streptomyces goshikiensis TaxID=1942 RepID=UPI0036B5DE66
MSAQIATSRGTWAEQVSLPARLLAAAPTTLALEDAAALPLAGVTALQALSRAAVTDGDNVLITGTAGAVGGIAVQLGVPVRTLSPAAKKGACCVDAACMTSRPTTPR